MELKDELSQYSPLITSAKKQTQDQLNNIKPIVLPISAALTLGGGILLQVKLNILLFWVPTSFVFWVLLLAFSFINQVRSFIFANHDAVLRKYIGLSNKRKILGRDTFALRLVPLSQSIATVYIISAIILLLAKSGIIAAPQNISIFIPITVDIFLAGLLLTSPLVYRSQSIPKMNKVAKTLKERQRLAKFLQSHVILSLAFIVLIIILIPVVLLGLPVLALIKTWGLYYPNVSWYSIALVLILQVLFFVLLSGYLTQFSARTNLSNYIVNLSNIELRVNQLLNSNNVSADDIGYIKNEYYEATKYRFVQERVLGFVIVYWPVLNEAYVKSNTK